MNEQPWISVKPLRGTRAGRNKQRQIRPRITHRDDWQYGGEGRGVNVNNIVPISSVENEHVGYDCQIPVISNHYGQPQDVPKDERLTSLKLISCDSDLLDRSLRIAQLNARSAVKKGDAIQDSIIDNNLDILALTETWFTSSHDLSVIHSIVPDGYTVHHQPRPSGGRGGGVALIYRSSAKAKVNSHSNYSTFEHLDITLTHDSHALRLVSIYRPPSSSVPQFITEFANLVDNLNLSNGKLVVLGDFNIHVDRSDNRDSTAFRDMLEASNLIQHVSKATHSHGHILDLIISRPTELEFSKIELDNSVQSDHAMVICSVSVPKLPFPRKTIAFRKWKSIDREEFKNDIRTTLIIPPEATAAEAVKIYNDTLQKIADKHAPLKKKDVIIRPQTPWHTEEIKYEKTVRRKYERQWKKTGLTIHKEMFQQQRNKVTNLIRESKSKHWTEIISEAKDQKELFDVTSKLLHKTKCAKLPSRKSDAELAEKFSEFFHKKIATIRTEIEENQQSLDFQELLPKCTHYLTSFTPATEADILKLIKASPTKSCNLDPIPTWLLKDYVEVLVSAITTIVNLSVTNGVVPEDLKVAHITPLLKKISLLIEILKNYRPVSGLPFISKILEKHVDGQMTTHDVDNDLAETFQSAYTKFSSTESALLRVQSDLLMAVDSKGAALLVLLDLSAAFDTIDHSVLLNRLEHAYGLKDVALAWMESYLTNRTQSVIINGVTSSPKTLVYGFPQGSVLGPKNFKRYSKPIGIIARKHGLSFHLYADDTQLYVTFSPKDQHDQLQAIKTLQNCITDIKDWMTTNFLKLNSDKTEIIVISKKNALPQDIASIQVADASIIPASAVKNLGVFFDTSMSMEAHINATCKRAFCEIRNIGRIRSLLDDKTAATLVHAFVSSKIDYCNSLLYGLPKRLQDKLQRVLNCAARVVSRVGKYDHITPILANLHWLPIPQRIEFKIVLMVFKALHGLAPGYLHELLVGYEAPRSLRSNDHALLQVPRTKLKSYGDRAFAKTGPVLWNNLPLRLRLIDDLDLFKSSLKTHLYGVAYK